MRSIRWRPTEAASRRLVVLGLMLAVPGIASASADEVAPDVVVFCEPSMAHAIGDVGQLWRARSGVPVRVFTAPTPLLLEQMAHGVRSDLLIGQGAQVIAAGLARGLVHPGPVPAWRDKLVLARAAPAEVTDFPTALAAAKRVAVVDEPVDASGQQSHAALRASGAEAALQGRIAGVVGTADALFLLQTGAVDAALIYASDLAASPGFAAAAVVPDGTYEPAIYQIAVSRVAKSPNTDRFGAFLRSAPAADAMRKDGLEVLP
jgi:molybdate transport system substrate-binding protein